MTIKSSRETGVCSHESNPVKSAGRVRGVAFRRVHPILRKEIGLLL